MNTRQPTMTDEHFETNRLPEATEKRRLGVFTDYADAQRMVDELSDQKFPVERVAIAARGLTFVEEVTGRLNWGKAALNGALSGAGVGVFLGFLFGLLDFVAPLVSAFVLALAGLLFGAVIGALFGLLSYGLTGGERDFTSRGSMQAERYEVLVDEAVAEQALEIIRSSPRLQQQNPKTPVGHVSI